MCFILTLETFIIYKQKCIGYYWTIIIMMFEIRHLPKTTYFSNFEDYF